MVDVTFQSATASTPPDGTVVETIPGVGNANRQVVSAIQSTATTFAVIATAGDLTSGNQQGQIITGGGGTTALVTGGALQVNVVAGGAGGGIVTQATAANLNAMVFQTTGANLNVFVSGGSITATGGPFIVTQVTGANLNTFVSGGTITATGGPFIVTQATAANLNATISGSINNTSFIATQATGTNLNTFVSGGTLIATQTTAANLLTQVSNTGTFAVQATATQATAANLNATVVGTGTFAVQATATQATAANLNATVVGTGTFAVQATATQATAANLNAQVVGNVAAGNTDSGNSVKVGGVAYLTTNPTAVATAQRADFITDKLGKQIVAGSVRGLKGAQYTTLATTTETAILTGVTGVFLDIYGLVLANSSATASLVTVRTATAGTTAANFYVPAGDTRGFMLPESAAVNQATAGTNWTATLGTSVSSFYITALYVQNL